MKAINAERPALRTMDGPGPRGDLIIFNSHNVRSYSLTRLKELWLYGYWQDESALLKKFDDATRRCPAFRLSLHRVLF
jgi:hypothetical protein